jgi:hypothetical protein
MKPDCRWHGAIAAYRHDSVIATIAASASMRAAIGNDAFGAKQSEAAGRAGGCDQRGL